MGPPTEPLKVCANCNTRAGHGGYKTMIMELLGGTRDLEYTYHGSLQRLGYPT